MPAPKGNTNAKNRGEFKDALHHALTNYEEGTVKRKEALREIAKTLITKAIDGDMTAIKEVADRLDGKAHQTSSSDVNVKVGYAGLLEEFSQRFNVRDAGEVETESGSVRH